MIFVCVWLVLSLATGCHRGSDSGPTFDEYIRVADKDDVPTLDPARGYDTASWQFEDLVFETLLEYADDGHLVGELARDWEVDAHGTRFVFYLRNDARFSTGRVVTAEDVRYGLTRVLAPSVGSPGRDFFLVLRGAEDCHAPGCRIDGLRAPDPHTLVMELVRPDPLFLHKVALPFAAAVPPEIVDKVGEDFGVRPVGSGPFQLVERVPGQRWVFARNPNYQGPEHIRLAGVVRFVGVSDDLAWMRYRSGQLDIAAIPSAEFLTVLRDPRLAALTRSGTSLRTQYVGLNCRRPPLDDRRVRQALNYAVDRHKLLRLLNGRGVPARGAVPPNMPGYPQRPEVYVFDRERARALLASAGHPHGFEATLWLRNDETALRIAQSLQQDWAAVGVQVRLKPLAWGPFLDAVRHSPAVDMFLLGWEADFPDPSNFLEVLFHSRQIGVNNHTQYSNSEVDALLERASLADPAQRLDLYRRAEDMVIEDAPWVFLYHPRSYVIVSTRLQGFRLHPWRPPRLSRTWLAGVQSSGPAAGGDGVPGLP